MSSVLMILVSDLVKSIIPCDFKTYAIPVDRTCAHARNKLIKGHMLVMLDRPGYYSLEKDCWWLTFRRP